ncbi:DUF6985 domain-containing protein [Pseudomonas sp. EA_35y_Pfl2_R5]|uniref:DUF6985 domain-containing protein n=1 Tax=Pseudomonas sp. EA_35y_Pfl2_R5 TaxID=3088690 RepID=UPI0030D710E7
MYNTNAPSYPEFVETEFFHVSTVRLPAFAGMQITNGPYGAVSEQGPSTGETHAVVGKELDISVAREVVAWVIEHQKEIRALLFPALVEGYHAMRELIIESLIDESPEDVVPEIQSPEELAPLCGLVALHIGGITQDRQPLFGIELGCNWEPEHGAGVCFQGLTIVMAGEASDAFAFPQ